MKHYQVVGIGNAIVDVIAPADDAFLARAGIEKGIMQLTSRERGEALYEMMEERVQAAGGSVGNTLAGVGALGLSTAYIGRVADDHLGQFYAAALAAEGTDFPNPPVKGADLPTSRSMIFVSPDGERSMNTYLGISADVSTEDVPLAVVENCDWLFLEGYLFDKDHGKAAFLKAAQGARRGGGKAGISLSDPFCVDRHRESFQRLIAEEMDFAIGNEHEWATLYETDLEGALALAAQVCETVVCTRGADTIVALVKGVRVEVPVQPSAMIDATGAGDQFAAGFIFGMATGRDVETALKMGAVAAGEVIAHYGARPEIEVLELFRAQGLI